MVNRRRRSAARVGGHAEHVEWMARAGTLAMVNSMVALPLQLAVQCDGDDAAGPAHRIGTMADAGHSAPHTAVGRLAHPDKSPRVADKAPHLGPAETSSFDTVAHYFDAAADRLGIAEDLRAVIRTAYREVQVQVPSG